MYMYNNASWLATQAAVVTLAGNANYAVHNVLCIYTVEKVPSLVSPFQRSPKMCAASNESTAGADASVKSLKLYDMKQLTLAYLALLGSSSSRSLYNCAKSGK